MLFVFLLLFFHPFSGLSCLPCNKIDCKPLSSSDCSSGELTLDVCKCCNVCAKAHYETCGGQWGLNGQCAEGFTCHDPDNIPFQEWKNGTCIKEFEISSLILSKDGEVGEWKKIRIDFLLQWQCYVLKLVKYRRKILLTQNSVWWFIWIDISCNFEIDPLEHCIMCFFFTTRVDRKVVVTFCTATDSQGVCL